MTATSTLGYFSANEFDADAATIELGKVTGFGENDLADITQTLSCILSGKHLPGKTYKRDDFNIFEIYQRINRYGDDFQLHFSHDIEHFISFNRGDLLASVDDRQYKVKKTKKR